MTASVAVNIRLSLRMASSLSGHPDGPEQKAASGIFLVKVFRCAGLTATSVMAQSPSPHPQPASGAPVASRDRRKECWSAQESARSHFVAYRDTIHARRAADVAEP